MKISTFENLKKIPTKINLDFISKKLSFEIDSSGEKGRVQFEKVIGEKILKSNKNLFVDLSNPNISFKIKKINKKIHILLDLIGFNLGKRDYKININSNSCNSFVVNYLFFLLELEKEKNLFIIDPVASLGDILIEASFFNPIIPINIKKKNEISFSKIFSEIDFPKNNINGKKNKFIGIVQNNKIFKQIKENISYSSQKIKISQYELDFLDVKFKKGQIDYLVSNLPSFKIEKEFNEFLKEFFYQAEFIIKKKIGIISKKEISLKIIKKYKLLIKIEKQILVGEQKYFIYVVFKEK